MATVKKIESRHLASLLEPSTPLSELFKLEPLEAVELVKLGIPARFLVRISQIMDCPVGQVARLLGLAPSTAARKVKANAMLGVNESERALGLAKLIGQVEVIVAESGCPEGFNAAEWVSAWLSRPAIALGGRRPYELMDTADGSFPNSSAGCSPAPIADWPDFCSGSSKRLPVMAQRSRRNTSTLTLVPILLSI